MSDLHAALLEAITARRDRAQAAAESAGDAHWRTGPPKRCECCNSVLGAAGFEVIATDDRLTEHIAAESPDAVLRQCERDLKVLTRHRPRLVPGAVGVQCDTCEPPDWRWPCIEITDLAEVYAIPVDAEGTQP